MKYRLEKFNTEKHYSMICKWWIHYLGKPLQSDILSDTGYMLYKGDMPVVAAWFYGGNSKLAFMGFPVSNPDIPARQRLAGLVMLTKRMKAIAEHLGYRYLFGMSSNSAYTKIMLKEGFDHYDKHDVCLYESKSQSILGRKGSRGPGSVGGTMGDSF